MEKQFRIVWKIDKWANSPEEAIAKAILSMPVPSNEETLATVFTVTEMDENSKPAKKSVNIDTLELEEGSEERERFVSVLDGETYGDDRDDDDQDRESYTV